MLQKVAWHSRQMADCHSIMPLLHLGSRPHQACYQLLVEVRAGLGCCLPAKLLMVALKVPFIILQNN